MAEPWCADADCWREYAHHHMTPIERIDHERKRCDCAACERRQAERETSITSA